MFQHEFLLMHNFSYLYVVLTIVICLVLGGVGLFFLSPRSLELSSDESPIVEVNVVVHKPLDRAIVINFLVDN